MRIKHASNLFPVPDSSPRTARSPTPPNRKTAMADKIPDTSLFAELVKDKHKRDKVLKEIIDKQEEKIVNSGGENSNSAITNNNNVVVIDTGTYIRIIENECNNISNKY